MNPIAFTFLAIAGTLFTIGIGLALYAYFTGPKDPYDD